MQTIRELQRLNSPFPKPQALYVDGDTLWVSSRITRRIYALARNTLEITWETEVPEGLIAWGLTKLGDELRAVVGGEGGTDDVRTIRRIVPGRGFDASFRLACPEDSGSHLSFDGQSLNLSQWYPQKIIALDSAGRPWRVLLATHQICGHCYAQGAFWLVTTDNEETNDYWLTRFDPQNGKSVDVARIGFPARALAFDGQHFWTNHREAHQIVCFAP